MHAAGKTNAEIARATIDYLKSREVEMGGDVEAVLLGEDPAPLATYWGGLEELADKTEDIMVVGSDPRNSTMFGWALPLNVDVKPVLRAVHKINKTAKEADADAETLKLTLVTKPDQFHVGRGPGPLEGMYLVIIECDDVPKIAGMVDAVADPKLAMRVDRTPALGPLGERVRISLQMAGMAGRIYAGELTVQASSELYVYSDAWSANEYKQGGKAWTALRQYFGSERHPLDVYQQYFDVVECALMAGKQCCAESDGTGQMLDVLRSCFDCVIRAGCDMANEMAERVADLEAERDMLRASRRVVETGVEAETPEWLSAAEGLLQVKTAAEVTPGEASEAAAEETSEEAREAAAECDRCVQAAVKLQRVWRLHSESVAQDRVRGFFAKAVAEEAWRRALTEFKQSMAMAAAQEAAEAAALAEEDARAQRKAEAKARLEVREAEERHKRKAREAEVAARKAAAQAARALPLPSPPSKSPRLPPSQPIDRPSPRRLFPSPSPPVTPPRPPPSQTADLSLPTPPWTADSPSPRSFLPSWRRAHMAACLLQRAWCNRVRREEAAAEARARECASDGEVASRLAVLEAEKAAMENRLANSVATARAFRRLEAELREQGIRLASGVGTGGRQRKRMHERRRAEHMVTSLLQRQLSMW